MRARSLPLSGCTVATTKIGDGLSWCESCRRHVTDLSAMTESDARAWLRRGPPGRRCVSYRVDGSDAIVFAPARAAILLGPWLALLLACAGHLDARVDADPSACRDAHGYEIDCPTPADDWRIVPDDVALRADPASRGPARSRGGTSQDDTHAPDGLIGASPLGPGVAIDRPTRPSSAPNHVQRPFERVIRVRSKTTRPYDTTQGFLVVWDHSVSIDVSTSPTGFAVPSSIEGPPTQAEALARAAERRAARRNARARRNL